MTVSNMPMLLENHRAWGAFNFVQLEVAEAIVAGAEQARTGVVLQLSENAVRFHGSLEPAASAALKLAESARVPVLVHLDPATDAAPVDDASAVGVRSVMFVAAHRVADEHVARTLSLAEPAQLGRASRRESVCHEVS